MLNGLPSDDAADFFGLLSHKEADCFLTRMEKVEVDDIKHLLTYNKGSAGALMTTDVITVSEINKVNELIYCSKATTKILSNTFNTSRFALLSQKIELQNHEIIVMLEKNNDFPSRLNKVSSGREASRFGEGEGLALLFWLQMV